MAVRMELARIIISDVNNHQVVYLREVGNHAGTPRRMFPILIGKFEAEMIQHRVQKDFVAVRPLTHDLVLNIVTELGGELQDVLISELREHTYYARLRIRRDGEIVEVDSRPSDAIAVAVTRQPPLPIYVNEEVLDEVGS